MPKMQEYICSGCNTTYDYTHMSPEDEKTCPTCGSHDGDLRCGGRTLTTIIPSYPGSKRMAAGYVHSHGDRPAEKGSVQVPRAKGDAT